MLQANHLRKTFGEVVAVDDISFELPAGKIMGVIGQNGSGKTTMFRLILDFLTPEGGGSVLWKGKAVGPHMQNDIGYLPEERGLYEDISIEEQITLFGQLRGMTKKDIHNRIDEWMERFNVKGKKQDKISTLSKGNQQKVQVIATLIHEPELIILDEPFSGLDPVNADYLQQGILALRDKGSCILFSSHNMTNVEEICDSLLMIHHGKQVLSGTVNEVKNTFGRTRIRIESPSWDVESLGQLPGVSQVKQLEQDRYLLSLEDESFGPAIYQSVTQGQYIREFSQQAPSLDEIFKLKAGGSHV